jgi:hypothetical protein
MRQTSAGDIRQAIRDRFGMNNPPVSIMLIDAAPVLMSIEVVGMTKDPGQATVLLSGEFEVTNLQAFVKLMGSKTELRQSEIQRRLFLNDSSISGAPTVTPLSAILHDFTFGELNSESGQQAFLNRVKAMLSTQLAAYGLTAVQWYLHLSSDDPNLQALLKVQQDEFNVRIFQQEVQVADRRDQVLLEAKSLNLQRLRDDMELDVSHKEQSEQFEEREEKLRQGQVDRNLRGAEYDADNLQRKVRIREQLRDYRNSLGDAELNEQMGQLGRLDELKRKVRELQHAEGVQNLMNEAEMMRLTQTIANKQNFDQLLDDLLFKGKLREDEIEDLKHLEQKTRQQGTIGGLQTDQDIDKQRKYLGLEVEQDATRAEAKLKIERDRAETTLDLSDREAKQRLEQQRQEQQLRIEELQAKQKIAAQLEADSTETQIRKDQSDAALHLQIKGQDQQFELERIGRMSGLSPEQIALLSNSPAEVIQSIFQAKQGSEQMELMQKQMELMATTAAKETEARLVREMLEQQAASHARELETLRAAQAQAQAQSEANASRVENLVGKTLEAQVQNTQRQISDLQQQHQKEREVDAQFNDKLQAVSERENARMDDQNERFVDALVKPKKSSSGKASQDATKVNITVKGGEATSGTSEDSSE